jgi:hypothetical protein
MISIPQIMETKRTCSLRAQAQSSAGKSISVAAEFAIRSAPPRYGLSSVNPLANKRDGALIDRSSIPFLDSSKIGFAGLVSCGHAPERSCGCSSGLSGER